MGASSERKTLYIKDKFVIMPTIQIWPVFKVLFQYLYGGANREIPWAM